MNIHYQPLLYTAIIITMAASQLPNTDQIKDMAKANLDFTFDLLRQCGSEAKGQNVFFAPYSISTALAMTYVGARSDTAKQMKHVLKWPSDLPQDGFGSYLSLLKEADDETPGYILVGAQRIYVDKGLTLKPDFSTVTKEKFASEATSADFAQNAESERKTINDWVSGKTRSKIQNLLPEGSLTPLTAMVLVQALYFKGNWMHKFDASRTRPADFYSPRGKITVNMMRQERKFDFAVSDDLNCSAVELPYTSNTPNASGHDLSMLILLPNERDGVEKLEKDLTAQMLDKLRSRMHQVTVDLQLPRFSMESSLELKKVLSSLGMPLAFGDNADFSGLVSGPGADQLYISEVFHKAVIEVNEEGSEAAAATAVRMMKRSLPRIHPFIADHPFLVFIVDKRADVVLFAGRVASPGGAATLKDEL